MPEYVCLARCHLCGRTVRFAVRHDVTEEEVSYDMWRVVAVATIELEFGWRRFYNTSGHHADFCKSCIEEQGHFELKESNRYMENDGII